ncbi:hypothetical protein D3C78_1073160 [compost metagenome]
MSCRTDLLEVCGKAIPRDDLVNQAHIRIGKEPYGLVNNPLGRVESLQGGQQLLGRHICSRRRRKDVPLLFNDLLAQPAQLSLRI